MRSQSIRIVSFLFFALAGWLGLLQADPVSPLNGTADPDGNTVWYDGARLGVEGRGWTETESFYDRLPSKAKTTVPAAIWELSHDTAGMCFRFVTDAPEIQVRYKLLRKPEAMSHMSTRATSGMDLYCCDKNGKWVSVFAHGKPNSAQSPKKTEGFETAFYNVDGSKEIRLYLPSYNGMKSVEFGIPRDRIISRPAPPADTRVKPVLFYGTSITQGASASRPGKAFPAIVGRSLDVPIINLGFAGGGRMEPELADLLGELDPSIYVLDCTADMEAELIMQRAAPFVMKLRQARPATPILLVEDPNCWNRSTVKGRALRSIYERLKKQGVTGLFFLPNKGMWGDDGEATVDGVHPSDLGMMRQAAVFIEVLPRLLQTAGMGASKQRTASGAGKEVPASAEVGVPPTPPDSSVKMADETDTVWYDGARFDVEGRGWTETESFYDRLPAKARGTVRDSVWKLSHATAGMCIRFVTDAPTIQVRWIITGLYSLSTMPKTACSGVDLYCREAAGKWTFVGTGEPTGITNTALFSVGASKELMLYLPLYTGVKSVEIGIPKGRTISKPAPRAKPIIFYGTSITQGACASRPGMVYTAIVGRRLDRPVINLGFSANGTGDTELADLMGEIDASIYIVDCAANMKSNGPYAPEKQAPLFVTRLRKLRPATPILLVQGADRFDRPSEGGAWRSVYEQLKKQGMTGLFFLPNKGMYGDDGEATGSDGHPSDLGMMREAAVYIRALPSMLKTTGRSR